MKKLLTALVLAAILMINSGAAAGGPEYSVTVKTGIVEFTDAKPVSMESITYIPLRVVFEKLGCEVTWHPDTKTASVRKDKTLLLYTVPGNKFFINGEEKRFKADGLIINDRVLVPVDFFSTLGMEVSQEGTSIALICKSCR